MHPLWHLIPAMFCAGLAIAGSISMALDLHDNTLRLRSGEVAFGAAIILVSTVSAAISVAEVLL
jgi:hypothetical protein